MMKKKAKQIGWAVVLLIMAAAVIVNALGILEKISVLGIAIFAAFTWLLITGALRRKWVQMFVSAAFLPYVALRSGFIPEGTAYDVIDQLTPWALLAAGLLLGFAFNMIFKKDKVSFNANFVGNGNGKPNTEYFEDGEIVNVSNCFGETTKYVNSSNFRCASIDNSFGQTNIYFNNVILSKEGATIDVDNSFGQICVYLPNTWRVVVKRDNSFGSIKENGMCNADMDAPLVTVVADTSFGEIDIFYI